MAKKSTKPVTDPNSVSTLEAPVKVGRNPRFWPIFDKETGEELLQKRNVTLDFPALLGALKADSFSLKNYMNLATTFRFGAILAGWLLGESHPVLKEELLWHFKNIQEYQLTDEAKGRMVIEEDRVVIFLK